MRVTSRRGFLTGTALGAAALGAAGTATAAPALLRREVTAMSAPAVVVGSGTRAGKPADPSVEVQPADSSRNWLPDRTTSSRRS